MRIGRIRFDGITQGDGRIGCRSVQYRITGQGDCRVGITEGQCAAAGEATGQCDARGGCGGQTAQGEGICSGVTQRDGSGVGQSDGTIAQCVAGARYRQVVSTGSERECGCDIGTAGKAQCATGLNGVND